MAVRTYYKHTRVRETRIPYSFECENCKQNSGNLQAHIVGAEAIHNSNFREISDDRAEKLEKQAYKNLAVKVKKAYKDATEKGIYWTEFKDECPHCHKSQSWGVSGLKKNRFDTPFVIFGVGIMLFIVLLIGHYVTLPIAFGILGASFVCAVISFIWNTIKINMRAKETSASGTKNLPNIDWNRVQELLNAET